MTCVRKYEGVGDNAAVPPGVTTDYNGNARISEDVVDLGAYERCLVIDTFALTDWEPDCDVDLADFAAFQACFDPGVPADTACRMAFDRAFPPCGFIDLDDLSTFQSWLQDDSETGCGGPLPHVSCQEVFCQEGMMSGGGGESMAGLGGDSLLDSGELEGDPPIETEDVPPPAIPWTLVESPVVVEIRPLDGGAPLTVLAPNTVYEVHYSGATQAVQGYFLSASGVVVREYIASASPPFSGFWSGTGLFAYVPLDDGAMVLDDLPGGEADSGPTGGLCTITTASEGELNLELKMYFSDPVASVTYEMSGGVIAAVSAP